MRRIMLAAGITGHLRVTHRPAPAPRRILGSSSASSMSERKIPTTVRNAMNMRKDPARYMSCERKRREQHRPGDRQRHHHRDDDRAGNQLRQQADPISAMKGLSEMRKG